MACKIYNKTILFIVMTLIATLFIACDNKPAKQILTKEQSNQKLNNIMAELYQVEISLLGIKYDVKKEAVKDVVLTYSTGGYDSDTKFISILSKKHEISEKIIAAMLIDFIAMTKGNCEI